MSRTVKLCAPKAGQPVVLVAEDEPLVLKVIQIALEAEGYFVVTAVNGGEALTLSRRFLGAIHLLVSDIKMPVMTGTELRHRILKERPGMKVLLISGQVNSPSKDIPFLRKPFHPSVLKERVRALLSSTDGSLVTGPAVQMISHA
jgi:DNA-binding response OmpR family regulator